MSRHLDRVTAASRSGMLTAWKLQYDQDDVSGQGRRTKATKVQGSAFVQMELRFLLPRDVLWLFD